MRPAQNFYQAVYEVVRAIPHGQVTTYGAVATWIGAPRAARAVGYALAADLQGDVPWQRVINAKGEISEGGAPWRADEQRRRLLAEGVHLEGQPTLPLPRYSFAPTKAQLRRWLALGEKIRALRRA